MTSRRQRRKMEQKQPEEQDKEKLDLENPELITYNIQPHNVSVKVKWDFIMEST